MIDLQRDGDVFVLRLDDGENRFSFEMCRQINEALDEIEAAGSPAALVTTGTGKFFSNGLDLDEMIAAGEERAMDYLRGVLDVLARFLTFPTVTVAAVNGHAFGAGAQLLVAHDYRVMRNDRGYFCMPEIDMRLPLHPFMTEILRERLPLTVTHEVIVTGRRYGGEDAAAAGIVDHAVAESKVVSTAKSIASGLAAKADPVMHVHKRELHRRVLDVIGAPLPV
ncbi:MAG: enoyl-CoA hydratase/isomerase family protein [Myxococcales bacterium]|jgi:enoyl-CoA hydratase/carnithine racemase|nr:MAG: enoyl-CoA hydratase/isomerase family protein [Myxococcales bacterium]